MNNSDLTSNLYDKIHTFQKNEITEYYNNNLQSNKL